MLRKGEKAVSVAYAPPDAKSNVLAHIIILGDKGTIVTGYYRADAGEYCDFDWEAFVGHDPREWEE